MKGNRLPIGSLLQVLLVRSIIQEKLDDNIIFKYPLTYVVDNLMTCLNTTMTRNKKLVF